MFSAATKSARGTSAAANYIEDVFSTYLYTGNDTTQTINNGLQLGGAYTSGGTGGNGLFNGTTGYLSVPTGSALNLSGDFTIEAYVYLTDYNGLPSLFGNGDYPTSAQVVFAPVSGGYFAVYMANGSAWGFNITSSVPIPLSTWTHVALTCSGSTFTIWVNGISTATGTYSGARVTPNATSVIGRLYSSTNSYYWTGSISNFRVVKGTALYTSNFTVSSSALTAVSGTQLLCLQGTTPFVDNSTNALTITVNGGATASTSGPFPYTYTAGKGGLVWLKTRSTTYWHNLIDTARGAGYNLWSNDTAASTAVSNGLISFNGNGFTLGGYGNTNGSAGGNYVSWSFAEQAKFFDVVTYTGNGSGSGRTISHNLGSAPGMIILKVTNLSGDDWYVYHRSIPTRVLALNSANSTNPTTPAFVFGNGTTVVAPTSTEFTIGSTVNPNGYTYVAYLFAHNAGGFGTTGTDNVISCGSFTTAAGSGSATVNLGYEPQYLMFKRTDSTGNWFVVDNMRNWNMTTDAVLYANLSNAESNTDIGYPTATGFYVEAAASATYIYMAIRRPMKVPTDATTVFSPQTATYSANQVVTTNFPVDMTMIKGRTITLGTIVYDRLRGIASTNTSPVDPQLITSDTSAETSGDYINTANNTGYQISPGFSGFSSVNWNFSRRPGFFDVVCYTGNGTSSQTLNHNLTVSPEFLIVKRRDTAANWVVYTQISGTGDKQLVLNTTSADGSGASFQNGYIQPLSATQFLAGGGTSNQEAANASGGTYVAYLFATCAGVSKVGSYTGNGTTQAISCGFTGGARFVLIKRTDSTGGWYVYDTARGMTLLVDPYLQLNSTAAESATLGSVITSTGGFTVDATILAAVNTNAASYIFLAIA